MTTLYFETMKLNPEKCFAANRDRFVLSKGHAAIGLYSVMMLRGYFPLEEMKTFDKINSRLQAHPDMKLLPGLDFSTGSLGQGISGAAGIALGAKLKGYGFKTYCLIGDGESQEGQVWEAIDFAVKYSLDNLIVIVDCNNLQQFGFRNNSSLIRPINDSEDKFKSFGCNVMKIDGHDIEQIISSFESIEKNGKPTVIIANTIKGKGISFMENEPSWHSRVPTDEELKLALEELK
jgi:transketolase